MPSSSAGSASTSSAIWRTFWGWPARPTWSTSARDRRPRPLTRTCTSDCTSPLPRSTRGRAAWRPPCRISAWRTSSSRRARTCGWRDCWRSPAPTPPPWVRITRRRPATAARPSATPPGPGISQRASRPWPASHARSWRSAACANRRRSAKRPWPFRAARRGTRVALLDTLARISLHRADRTPAGGTSRSWTTRFGARRASRRRPRSCRRSSPARASRTRTPPGTTRSRSARTGSRGRTNAETCPAVSRCAA